MGTRKEKILHVLSVHSMALLLCSFVFFGVGYDNWDEEGDLPILCNVGWACFGTAFLGCFVSCGLSCCDSDPDFTPPQSTYYDWEHAAPAAPTPAVEMSSIEPNFGPSGAVNIFAAARDGNIGAVRDELNKGAYIDALSPNMGYTVLMVAAENGHLQIVVELLNRGANAGMITSQGFNATDLAAFAGKYDIANYLYNSGHPGVAPGAPGQQSAVQKAAIESGATSAYAAPVPSAPAARPAARTRSVDDGDDGFHAGAPEAPPSYEATAGGGGGGHDTGGGGGGDKGRLPVPVPGFEDDFRSFNHSRWWKGCKQWGGWEKICTLPDCTYTSYIPCDGTNDDVCCKDTAEIRKRCKTDKTRDYINGGVVPPNAYIDQFSGDEKPNLKLRAFGDLRGVDDDESGQNSARLRGGAKSLGAGSPLVAGLTEKGCDLKAEDDLTRYKRVGGAVITKDYYASGRYTVRMKVAPEFGVCSTIWTFYYAEYYPGDKEYDDVCMPNGDVPCPHWDDTESGNAYHSLNHEIDIEIPTMATYTRDGKVEDKKIDFTASRLNSWVGEVGGYEYEAAFLESGMNHADGEYHTYVIDWHTGDKEKNEAPRVEYRVDGDLKLVTYDTKIVVHYKQGHKAKTRTYAYANDKWSSRSKRVIPTRASKFWIGAWFPPRWTGSPRFDTAHMEIDYVKIEPFFESGDEWERETFRDAEVCDGACPYSQE
eukprot:GFYU01003369.1.p1 GENE.GFYU01003369.1~~GFYU01003369.1.p1  ORF type:complete len:708 (-),score=160.47 GFYU01003369.1:38-2161(-)